MQITFQRIYRNTNSLLYLSDYHINS